ncbi:hypothetical protein HBI31_004880 [Parastagonospora nodorum]|nr:hypothetical protein HBI31_004880 [Parastagonospora nodorum]
MPNFSDCDFPPLRQESVPRKRRTDADVGRASGAPASITDFPNELLLAILQYLPGIDLDNFQLPTLVSLSRVNRRFHNLVAAELYATYNSFFCEPYLFLRSIISNADLARRVRHVDITYGENAHEQRKRYVANAQDKKAIKDGLRASGIADWKTLASLYNTDHVELESIYAAIIMQTPKIASMIVHDGWLGSYGESRNPDWVDLFRRANSRTSPGLMHKFENLQSLTVELLELKLIALAPALRTPSLRKLTLKGLVEFEYGGKSVAQVIRKLIPSRCNNIEELSIKQSILQNDILAVVVEASQHLRVFSYDITLDNVGEAFDLGQLGSKTLIAALESQSDSLESLVFLKDRGATEDLPPMFDLCGSLRGFSSLAHLKCQLESIAGDGNSAATLPQRLPPALKTMSVSLSNQSGPDTFDPLLGLKHLSSSYTTRTPHLQEIRLVAEDIVYSGRFYDYAGTVALFSRTDIKFILGRNVLFDDSWTPQRTAGWGFHAVPDDEVTSESSGEISLYSNN